MHACIRTLTPGYEQKYGPLTLTSRLKAITDTMEHEYRCGWMDRRGMNTMHPAHLFNRLDKAQQTIITFVFAHPWYVDDYSKVRYRGQNGNIT